MTASAENEEDVMLLPPHGEEIELGLRRQEISIDALPTTSNSNLSRTRSALSLIYLSGSTSVTCYVRETDTIWNHEMCAETGFGPKQESGRPCIKTTGIKLTRWRLASAVLRENQHIWGQYARQYIRIPEVEAGCPIYEFPAENLKADFVAPQVKNLPGDDLLGRGDYFLRSLLLLFATAAYGGVHVSAWHEYFVTEIERHWWRFSSIFIAASGVFLSFTTAVNLMRSRTAVSHGKDHMPNLEGGFWAGLAGRAVVIVACTAGAAIVIYVAARSYLVVEALISLRQLPITAYQTPSLVQLIPHL